MTRSGWIHRRSLATVAAGATVIAGLAGANTAGLRFNATPSMPIGVWRMVANRTPLHRGAIAVVCLPDTAIARVGAERGYIPPGSCPGDTEPLVKPIAAIPGDVVAVSPAGVTVNSEIIRNTAQLARDSAGRPLRPVPAGAYLVTQGKVWLLSGRDPRSFDSRYFGPVPEANVQGLAEPILVLR